MSGLRFFFDRSCPIRVARVIDAFDEDSAVRHFDDDARFDRTASDVEWITTLAADPPWAVVSMDTKILTRPHEVDALRSSGMKFFLLGKGWMAMSLHAKVWRFLKTWPNVVDAARNQRAKLYEVSAGGQHKVMPVHR